MKQKRGLGAFYAIWQWNKLDLSTAPRAHKDHQITSSLHDVNITAALLLSDAGRLTNLMWSQWQAKHTMGECQCLTTFSSSSVLLLFVVKYTHFWANKEEWKVRCINTIHCDIHDAGQQTTAYICSYNHRVEARTAQHTAKPHHQLLTWRQNSPTLYVLESSLRSFA